MDCFRFGGWLSPSPKKGPGFLRHFTQPTPHHHHHPHRNQYQRLNYRSRGGIMTAPDTGQTGTHRVVIRSDALDPDHLREYIRLELNWKIPAEELDEWQNTKQFVLILPKPLTSRQMEDIDFLRTEDADDFLNELRAEKKKGGGSRNHTVNERQ